MPDAGLSAGMGSEPTDTMCVMRRSASVLGEMAASILGNRNRGIPLEKACHRMRYRCQIHLRAQIEFALYDGVDVSPDHVPCALPARRAYASCAFAVEPRMLDHGRRRMLGFVVSAPAGSSPVPRRGTATDSLAVSSMAGNSTRVMAVAE